MSSESGTGASMMHSTVLTDLGLIYMLQQQQSTSEGTMMLSGSLPLLMSSCQVMALHPGMSQQLVSSSSTGTSPSSLAKSPLLSYDGSVIWQNMTGTEDQLSDNFEEEHQSIKFNQQQGGSGSSQMQASVSGVLMTSSYNNQQLFAVNGNAPCYSVINPTSSISQSAALGSSIPPKVIVTVPSKAGMTAPKKPLTPYMKFSKSIWQHVKNANPSLSVCEVGASIGRLWREMTDADKQKYNDEFQRDKAVYEMELQDYLHTTGLQISDLTRAKKKDSKDRFKSSCSVATTTNQSLPQNIPTTSQTLSYLNITSTAAGQNSDGDGSCLPHISQMWSDHSTAHQLQVASRNQTVLKAVCTSFDAARFKEVEPCLRLNENLNNDLNQSIINLAVEMPSGVPWTWIKAIDQVSFSRSIPVDVLDASQSACLQQNQDGLKVAKIFESQNATEFSSTDGLEPGEVVVKGIDPSSEMNASICLGNLTSAHNMYNSYEVNPWNQYKLTSERLNVKEAIFDREQILKTELIHLRGSLSEKTKEVEQLMKELEMAYKLISKLQNPDASPSWQPVTVLPVIGKRDFGLGDKKCCKQNFSEYDQEDIIGINCGNREIVAGSFDELTGKDIIKHVSEKNKLKEEFFSEVELSKSDSTWCEVITSHLPVGVGNSGVSETESQIEKSDSIVIVGDEILNPFEDKVQLSNINLLKSSGHETMYHSMQITQGLHRKVEPDNNEITNELLNIVAKQRNCGENEFNEVIVVEQHSVEQHSVDQHLDSLTPLQFHDSQKDHVIK